MRATDFKFRIKFIDPAQFASELLIRTGMDCSGSVAVLSVVVLMLDRVEF